MFLQLKQVLLMLMQRLNSNSQANVQTNRVSHKYPISIPIVKTRSSLGHLSVISRSSVVSFSRVAATLLLLVTMGIGNARCEDTTDTYDFKASGVTKVSGPNAGNMESTSNNVVLKSKSGNTTDSWTIAFTGSTAYGYGSGTGIYIGTGSRELHATLTGKSYNNVTKVEIISTTSNKSVTLAVSVGTTDFGSQTATDGNSKTQSYTHAAATGTVTISVESTTKTQFKIEKIIITCSSSGAVCSNQVTLTKGAENNGSVILNMEKWAV